MPIAAMHSISALLLFSLVATHFINDSDGKTGRAPRRPFEKERMDAEMKLIGEYGLRNKREVRHWNMSAVPQ